MLTLNLGDDGYPSRLANVAHAPKTLYVRGDLNSVCARGVAIVGTRHASEYGLQVARNFAADFARAGLVVFSGMARGVDQAAQRAALLAGGRTVAVLGCGADVCYPAESQQLKAAIEQQGAVVSQFPPGTGPRASQFPARNRIVSALADAVVVIEAGQKSGALITADFAIEQDRPLFAVPGNVLRETFRGSHRLLREGVALVAESAADVLEELGLKAPPPLQVKPLARPTDPTACTVLDVIAQADPPLEVEEIVRRSGIKTSIVIRVLTRMELEGRLNRAPGNLYRIAP